jgi:hypothetical protein
LLLLVVEEALATPRAELITIPFLAAAADRVAEPLTIRMAQQPTVALEYPLKATRVV